MSIRKIRNRPQKYLFPLAVATLFFLLKATNGAQPIDNATTLNASGGLLTKDSGGISSNDGNKENQTDVSNFLDLVTVADPFNAPDDRGIGAVNKIYQIGTYEVTARQYATFLNAVASKEDPYGLYHLEMGSDKKIACIQRNANADGTYTYTLINEQRGDLPITYVSLNDAERFCNWLENGSPGQNEDPQILKESTESGAYTFLKNGNQSTVEANPNAHHHIPSDDEWMKAAYYKGGSTTAGYWMYPTQHDTAPGSGIGDVTNFANYQTYQGSMRSHFLDPDLKITTVNAFDQTGTFYQTHDMGGNVAEWTIPAGASRLALARGGSWQSVYSWYGNNDLMRTSAAKSYDPATATNFIGFRIAVAVDADPLSNQKNQESSSQPSQATQIDTTAAAPASNASLSDEAFLKKMVFTGAVLLGSSLLFIGAEIAIGVFWPEEVVAVAVALEEGATPADLAEAVAEIAGGGTPAAPAAGVCGKFLKTLEAFPPRRIIMIATHLLMNAYAITKAEEVTKS